MTRHWPDDFMPGDKPTTPEHVVAKGLEASIVQWWQTPPRLDFAAEAVTAALAEAGYEIVPAAELKALRGDRNDQLRQVFRRTGERDAALDGIGGKGDDG